MITIPKPCHENWNEMSPKAQGRLCDKCCKVVVDFTKKTTNQIVEILQARSGQKVCGRFRSEQVAVPVPVSTRRIPRVKVFLAAVYFVFGGLLFSSCHTSKHEQHEVMGRIAPTHSFSGGQSAPDTLRKDSVIKKGSKRGNVCPVNNPEPVEIETYKMGDVAWDPRDTVNNK